MIAVLGISHKSAPVSVRERYAFDEAEILAFSEKLKSALLMEGLVILSTCNRSEIYFNTLLEDEHNVYQLITGELLKFKNTGREDLPSFYFLTQGDAIKQILKVSAGLDSLILGEEQILAQVKEAFRFSQENQLCDCIISRLLIKSIEAGKRVRTETQINKGAASISYAAVELSCNIYPDLQNRKTLLIGAGQTGELFLQCMLKKGNTEFIIANRTFSRASELAEKYSGRAIELSDIENHLPLCDLVITATSSKEHLVNRKMAEHAMIRRKERAQVYIDLSVPSNIAENVKEIENVHYYSVDDLKAVVNKNVERRRSAIDHSLEIIQEVFHEYLDWLDIQNLTPTIISIKENMKNIHQAELEDFLRYNKITEHDLIEQYSEMISEKYAQLFIKKLKQVTENGKKTEYIRVINGLFESIEHE